MVSIGQKPAILNQYHHINFKKEYKMGKFKLGDRDFHLSEFRRFLDEDKINESTGGYLTGLIDSLRNTVNDLSSVSKYIKDSDTKEILAAITNLEKLMRKKLKNKGLIGW